MLSSDVWLWLINPDLAEKFPECDSSGLITHPASPLCYHDKAEKSPVSKSSIIRPSVMGRETTSE